MSEDAKALAEGVTIHNEILRVVAERDALRRDLAAARAEKEQILSDYMTMVRAETERRKAAEAQRDALQKRLDKAVPRIVEDTLADVADFTDGRVTFASDAIDRFIERAIARAASQSKEQKDG